MIKMFWNDEILNEGVSASEAIESSFDLVLDKFYNLSETENSFLGIKTKDDNVIQFSCIREDVWLTDIPIITEKGSFERECEFQECVEIIKSCYSSLWKIPSGFIFKSW